MKCATKGGGVEFDRNLGEEQVRGELSELFGKVGTVLGIRLPTDPDHGGLKGFG